MGTLTIAGQTVTVSQSGVGQGAGLVASFKMFDPARQSAATTECQFRSLTSTATTCASPTPLHDLSSSSISPGLTRKPPSRIASPA